MYRGYVLERALGLIIHSSEGSTEGLLDARDVGIKDVVGFANYDRCAIINDGLVTYEMCTEPSSSGDVFMENVLQSYARVYSVGYIVDQSLEGSHKKNETEK